MKNLLSRVLAICLVLFTVFTGDINAQDFKMKFGKINMDELKMTEYDKDTSASAVILGDFGNIDIEYNKNHKLFGDGRV